MLEIPAKEAINYQNFKKPSGEPLNIRALCLNPRVVRASREARPRRCPVKVAPDHRHESSHDLSVCEGLPGLLVDKSVQELRPHTLFELFNAAEPCADALEHISRSQSPRLCLWPSSQQKQLTSARLQRASRSMESFTERK